MIPMELPIEIKTQIESLAGRYSTCELKEASKHISDIYLNSERNSSPLLNSVLDVVTYAVVRMPATYASISHVLEHSLSLYKSEINTLLDVGSGTGAATIAVSNYLNHHLEITCLEKESSMVTFAKELFANYPLLKGTKWINEDFSYLKNNYKADLVIASYALNELKKDDLLPIVERLYNASNKLLVIIEPGTVKGYEEMTTIREHLIKLGGHIIAPCPHMNKCPLTNDWCHFSTRLSRSKLHKLLKGGDAPYEDEKFTYLIISKDDNFTKVNNRILRHPYNGNGYIGLNLCTDSGLKDIKVTKKEKEKYKLVKKLSVGDNF